MPEVHVFAAAGRTPDQKRGLMRDISEAVVKNFGSPLETVTVQIIEAPLHDKMKGGETFADRAVKKP